MADLVVRDRVGYKRRNPWGVFGLSIVTFGVYFFVWWYKINNELNNYGVMNDPTKAVLAMTIGWIIIVPPLVSTYNTADRILKAQQKVDASERMIPVLALLLSIVVGLFSTPYFQSQLNKVWDAEATKGAEIRPV